MGKGQKIVTTVLWGLAVLAMLTMVGTGLWAKRSADARERVRSDAGTVTLAASTEAPAALPVLYAAPEFSLIDQDRQTITTQSLRGDVWVAMVFFSNCPGICPGMIGRMFELQEALPDPRVKLVPFSIDPERDTPEALKQYADRIGADAGRWHLLTGTKEQMFAAADGLKLAAEPAAEGPIPFIHSGKLLLVDTDGNVRGVYDHKDEEEMKQLAADAKRLLPEAK